LLFSQSLNRTGVRHDLKEFPKNNTPKISLATMIAIIGIATSIIAINEISNETSQLGTQELVIQEIKGSMDNYTLEELASGANYAIIGTVKQITPVIVEKNIDENRKYKTIFSDVEIQVEKDLNGLYTDDTISVRIQGGQSGNLKVVSELDPTFEVNELALFFVADKEPNSIWGDNYYVAGLHLGKYSLSDGDANREKVGDRQTERDLISKIQTIRGNK